MTTTTAPKMTQADAYALVVQRFMGIIGGLNPEDALLVAEEANRRACDMLLKAQERYAGWSRANEIHEQEEYWNAVGQDDEDDYGMDI